MVFSVIFQEVFRFLIYLLLDKTDSYLKKLTENEETQIFANKHILAYVVGLGFGLMSGAFSLVNVLAASIGPGTLGFHGEAHNFFIVSSIMTLCMILLNTAWGVIFFASIDSGIFQGSLSLTIVRSRKPSANSVGCRLAHVHLVPDSAEQQGLWRLLRRHPGPRLRRAGGLRGDGGQGGRGLPGGDQAESELRPSQEQSEPQRQRRGLEKNR